MPAHRESDAYRHQTRQEALSRLHEFVDPLDSAPELESSQLWATRPELLLGRALNGNAPYSR